MAGALQGIEIPITINADGTVSGFDSIIAGIEKVKEASKEANQELDKTDDGGRTPGGRSAKADAGFFGTRFGRLAQTAITSGLSFVERALPALLDPTKSKVEAGLAAAPLAARMSAQAAAGAGIAATQRATGVELPETLKQQIIQTFGVAAEEMVKRMTALTRTQVSTVRAGLQATLQPFIDVGVIPSKEAMRTMADGFARIGSYRHAGKRIISEVLDDKFGGQVDQKDVRGALTPIGDPTNYQGAAENMASGISEAVTGGKK